MLLLSLILCLFSCTTKHLTTEQSEINFEYYFKSFQEIAEEYGYKATEQERNPSISRILFKDVYINISKNEEIYIRMSNSAYNSNKGVESFVIDYQLNNQDQQQFNTELFVDLVNAISGQEISTEQCDHFLEAPEDEYPASASGFKKLNGEKIAKRLTLNFFEDWSFYYFLDSNDDESLQFGGLTKQLKY